VRAREHAVGRHALPLDIRAERFDHVTASYWSGSPLTTARMQAVDAIDRQPMLPTIEQRPGDARLAARRASRSLRPRDESPAAASLVHFRRGSSVSPPKVVPLPGLSLWER
jgi:hypothetical protein